jgi:predicted transposase/invertase (TIGR01784 family)
LNPTTEEAMKMVGQMDPGIEIARKRLIELSADTKIRRLAEWREKQIRDINTIFNKSYQEGEEKGEEKKSILIARHMLWDKVPIAKITLYTHLPESEIIKLTPLDPNLFK